ncbi:MAG: MBOAT family protein [Leptospira sp.]|nr:MBOAT family protein [Leptospira sp.]
MLFTSLIFIIFFLAVYIVYWCLPFQKGKEVIILISSLIFYGSWSVPFLFHFVAFIVINFLFIESLRKTQSRKVLVFAIFLNLLNLGIFKYFYFFTNFFGQISGIPSFVNIESSSFKIILPLAISFYTFQMLAYVIDVYRKNITERISLFEFTIFIMFFPQLIAGPIMRSVDFMPQLKNIKFHNEFITPGLSLIAFGTLKKILIADNIALIIDPVWNSPSEHSALNLILAAYGFSWQVYCDFSGYTDIARGVAYLLGFHIPENFIAPYFADSPRDLWKRWHITLSTWMRDYMYISLGGNRVSELRSYVNQIITFTLGGLWHGANWTYVLWGFFHGVMLSLERILEKFQIKLTPPGKAGTVLRIIFVYHVFIVGVFFFRSNNMENLLVTVKRILLWESGIEIGSIETLLYLSVLGWVTQAVQYFEFIPNALQKHKLILIPASYMILLVAVGLYSKAGKEFVYFQF